MEEKLTESEQPMSRGKGWPLVSNGDGMKMRWRVAGIYGDC
jgi:hypothetical protein